MIPGWGVKEEAQWLIDNPQFDERPASMPEFLGEGYMEIDKYIRPGVRKVLIDIFGEVPNGSNPSKYGKALLSGSIGWGKSVTASIVLAYLCHWTLCLRDPQEFFGLMPGSRISFMMMSTSSDNARGVIFSDVKGRIENSPWFKDNYPYNDKWDRQIRFDQKSIWVVPGGSKETQFEGYNILGGILDEMDSHKAPRGGKDYADQGYDTIINRIQSRYGDKGLIMPIGQMKKSGGFAARKYAELLNDPEAYTVRMPIWESFGLDHEQYQGADGKPSTFYFDKMRKMILPDDYFTAYDATPGANIIRIPTLYISPFKTNPVKALRDLAGIPPASESPFISLTDRIMSARERWIEDEFGDPSDMNSVEPPVDDTPDRPRIHPDLLAVDSIPRVIHVDQAFSGQQESDAAGIAMGHISRMVDQDGEMKPYIHFDMLMRVKAPPGGEIMLQDLRQVLYTLRDDRGFKISKVTFDSFQSQSSVQILRKRRFKTDILSVDKDKMPYEDLRDAIYEERIGFPPYMTYLNVGDTDRVEIAVKELSELTDTGMKIDHPASGCFVGETRIPTLNGEYPMISELDGKETWVYSSTPEGEIVPGRARGRVTKMTTELVDVVLDNGAVVRCTPDHPWMLRNGEYKPASELTPFIDRLMPINLNKPINGGYSRVTDKNGQRTLTHNMVMQGLIGRDLDLNFEVVHHRDRNKLNNDPSNLDLMTHIEHKSHHANELWAEKKARMAEGHRAWIDSDRHKADMAKRDFSGFAELRSTEEYYEKSIKTNPNFRNDVTIETIALVKHAQTPNEAARMIGCGRNVIMARLRRAGYASWQEFQDNPGENHKVHAVIPVHLEEPVPVYDLEVDEWSNFALSCGVFVHNSKDVSDCMAAVVYTLIGDKKYRRSVASKKTDDGPGSPRRSQTPEGLLTGSLVNPNQGPAVRPAQVRPGMIPDPSMIQIPPHLRS